MDSERAALNLLGIAHKGGLLAIGRDPVRGAVHHGKASYLFLAADAGKALAGEIRVLGERFNVPVTEISVKERLGNVLGRGEVAVVAVTDMDMAEAVYKASVGRSAIPRKSAE